ncbi:hypothetical protein CASFOL_036698 [Castilleja foliolosa]|uniref:Uncharacterized protein n=1 Tax=Castilleja foliolosa TaxID=1961234 RepID=A0ABD3BPI4_9LAMI
MAAQEQEKQHEPEKTHEKTEQKPCDENDYHKLLSSYLGLSFSIFLGFLPKNSIPLLSNLQRKNKALTFKLMQAEDQLSQHLSRRKEDSKANARVVEIFANHRHSWQQVEKRHLQQIDELNEEIAYLKGKFEDFENMEADLKANVEDLKRELSERDEMLNFMSRSNFEMDGGDGGGGGECYGDMAVRYGKGGVSEEECFNGDEMGSVYGGQGGNKNNISNNDNNGGFGSEFLNSSGVGSKFWSEKASLWQKQSWASFVSNCFSSIFNIESTPCNIFLVEFSAFLDISYIWDNYKNAPKLFGYAVRIYRITLPYEAFCVQKGVPLEGRWRLDRSFLKIKIAGARITKFRKNRKSGPVKGTFPNSETGQDVSIISRKNRRSLQENGQASDPSETNLSSEFRTQRQTEFLREALRLQQHASETNQKLTALQTESGKSYHGGELEGQANLATKRLFDSIRNNFKEIQRNLEIWLARIVGDLEGLLARDGASRAREYYVSRYPFVQ